MFSLPQTWELVAEDPICVIFEEMEGKSCVWAEDDVVLAVDIFGLCLDDSGASNFKGGHFILVIFSSILGESFIREDLQPERHNLESDGWGCEQFIYFGSRLQSEEACPTNAHPENAQLAGAGLDSATSSGLRLPLWLGFISHHLLELQDRRDYAPADRTAGSMLVRLSPGSCTIGGLRRKTQLFSGTLYMAASSKTPPY
ncbi:hypothetical protein TNCV_3262691 [Trichonephila clavipes]|nr:hypothetical protein TNCV_3262691 [Trichonephila clavipes]